MKGEIGPPKAFLDNFDKKAHFDPLPSVPKDFKEFPERDLVIFIIKLFSINSKFR